jgi:hypothetical protein
MAGGAVADDGSWLGAGRGVLKFEANSGGSRSPQWWVVALEEGDESWMEDEMARRRRGRVSYVGWRDLAGQGVLLDYGVNKTHFGCEKDGICPDQGAAACVTSDLRMKNGDRAQT